MDCIRRSTVSQKETVAGFAYQKNWNLDYRGDWKIGVGYTLGITQREEYYYIPIPMPLPIVGIEYKGMALQAAYVPGLRNFGNVALFWLRVRLY
jgi:palmitoyl transferase